MKRDGATPVAERLKMGLPARVSQYVRRSRPCRRSDCGVVQGGGVQRQHVSAFSRPIAGCLWGVSRLRCALRGSSLGLKVYGWGTTMR